ncbi:recombinase family protein [Oceanobacillus timonensis]|uniref:recombinase family protein n=1 Tax=Oceanobacillus timonensis TaxID=1926285 RepID=UPI0009BAB7CA|nr:recombinase family protein [Oceanobacillus timonensis]
MNVGYIRVSSKGQNVDRQKKSLEEYGCEKVFIDKKSGKDLEREQYHEMKSFIREKDIVIFAELDRLGRNREEINQEWNDLINRGCDIKVLDMPILDTTQYKDDMGKFILTIARELLGYIAEQERVKLLERQRQGIEIAKQKGKYQGAEKFYRPDSKNPEFRYKYYQIIDLLEKKVPVSQISRDVRVSRNTVYRIKKEKDYASL